MATSKRRADATRLNECPDRCSGRESSRQRPLTAGELARLSVSARDVVSASSGSPYICRYCGCVYVSEAMSNLRLGTLDGGVTGPGWHSRIFP